MTERNIRKKKKFEIEKLKLEKERQAKAQEYAEYLKRRNLLRVANHEKQLKENEKTITEEYVRKEEKKNDKMASAKR